MRTMMNRQDHETIFPSEHDEEVLVLDERGTVSPSEQVERKLVALLKTATLPVSQLHQASGLRRKSEA